MKCDFGCGKEGVFFYKQSMRWCCSDHWSRCSYMKEQSSKFHTGKKPWNYNKKGCYSEETIEKMKESSKITLEKIKERYPDFLKEEDIRYKDETKASFQVHCKNPKCKNSKEKNGWFDVGYDQIYERIRQLVKPYGNKKQFLFCSERCKLDSEFFRIQKDPEQLSLFQKYYRKVFRETKLSVKINYNKIKNIELRGKKYGYDLDHKYSIYGGFINQVDPKIVGHWKNLRVINYSKNRKKHISSRITLEELRNNIISFR